MVAVSRRVLFAAALAILSACDSAAPPRVSPTEGVFRGGEVLRVEGSGFAGHGPLTIYVCRRSAKAPVIESDRLITLKTPRADQAGSCDLRLEFGDGHIVVIPGAFTYAGATAADAPSSFDRLGAPAEPPGA